MYYLFNKENTRVVIENEELPCVLSGELGNKHVTSVKPKEFSYLGAKWKGWCQGYVPVKVKLTPVQYFDHYFREGYTYIWLQGSDGTLYKVTYGEDSSDNYVEDGTVSLKLKGGRVDLPLSYFHLVKF
jgi:hypothetical protein